LKGLVTSIQADFYNRERRAGYKTLAHSTRRTRLSNLFDAVRGNSGKTATALTCMTKSLDLSRTFKVTTHKSATEYSSCYQTDRIFIDSF